MADLGMTKTLLILLLALRELKTPLSEDELKALQNEGFALEISTEYWEDIESALMAIIEGNEELNQKFLFFQRELELVEKIPPEILPTWEELKKELSYGDSQPVTFGVDVDDNPDVTPTTVAASTILKSSDSIDLVELNFLEKLKQILSQKVILNPDIWGDFRIEDIQKILVDIHGRGYFKFGKVYQPKGYQVDVVYYYKYRYINTGFYLLDNEELIETEQPLALDIATYILKVNIGKFWGIASPDKAIPEELLGSFFEKKKHLEMDVVVHSFDVKITSSVQKLQLPKMGNSEFLNFPITFTGTGRHSLDIDLLFHGHLLQSKRVEVYVVEKSGDEAPESAFPVQDAYITWTRSATLNPDELTFLKKNPRRLTIVTERDIDHNRIGLRFYDNTGKDLGCQHSQLTDDNLTQVLAAVRTQLRETMVNGYGGSIGSNEEVLTKHLGKLADIGRSFYRELLPKLAGQKNQVERGENLKVNLQPKTIIQVAPLSSQLGVPWELLYERTIETYRKGRIKLCPTWKEHGAKPEDCPSYGTKEERKTVCPHSFWGYRYIIEQLPCKVMPHASTPEHSLPLLIRNQSPLQFKAIVSTRLDSLNKHWQNLRNLASKEILELLKLDSLDKVESALFDVDNPADILYFYTHGGNDTFKRPYFEVGDGEKIKKNDLDAWNINFNRHQPLIVLNACDSAGYSPESFENLLQFFYDRGAAGVIGTQCEVKEMLANELIIHFFESFLQQNSAGEALFKSRKSLLREYLDPRGLVYSLFASADVKLAQEVLN